MKERRLKIETVEKERKKKSWKSLQSFDMKKMGEDLWNPFWVDKRDKGNTDWKTI